MKPLRKISAFFFWIAEKLDSDYVLDASFDIALDTGDVGLCEDCDRCPEPLYCR